VIAGVAAGHVATAEAGYEILEDGGTAADAAVAATLASCVAETLMTGLLGGGHAIVFEAATRRVRNLDCFVAVPSGRGAPMEELRVPFGEELIHYAIGASSCAVPGVPAGVDAVWRDYGRLPWPRVVEPALRLAREGVTLSPAHAACLRMLEPVMTMREGGRMYAPGGSLLDAGETLHQPGLARVLELLSEEGATSAYTGSLAAELLALVEEREGTITASDLAGYAATWSTPVEASFAGRRILTRGGVSGLAATFDALRPGGGAEALLAALESGSRANGDTTNVCAIDRDGNACVFTTSLGLGSGDWIPGLDLHLNSMLGEADLLHGPLLAGERMESMMAPTLALDRDGLELAIGAAGGTRLRTALVGVAAAILDEDVEPQDAVDRPRFHPFGNVVHAEAGVDEEFLDSLERRGRDVRRWPDRHHYFGGVSAIGRSAAAADPRRTGATRVPEPTEKTP
jgi:gamma-glutamyltranspeptidase / glutathione hydrolase